MNLVPLKGKAARSVARSNARINLWEGSVRSSKTVASLVAFLVFVRTAPPGPLLLVGRTERTAKANIIDVLQTWLGKKRCRYVKGTGELYLLGRLVHVRGASSEQAEEKIRGTTYAGAYVDEASLAPESFWNMMLSRCSIPGARIFATTNPDSPYHWLKKKFIDRVHELDINVFHFRLDDNPHLTDDYKTSLKAEYGPGTLWYRRYIDGLWVLAEGAVYDMWSDTHVIDVLPPVSAVQQAWLGIDYGTSAPFVGLLMLHVTEPFEHLLVAREWRWDSQAPGNRQKTDKEYSEALTKWLKVELPGLIKQPSASGKAATVASAALSSIIVDPSAASFIRQLHVDGYQRVWAADNAVIDGIRSTSSLLTARRVLVHSSCTGLIEEMAGYSWDEKRQKKGEDAPIKRDDHGPDTLRYLVQGTWRVWKPWVAEEVMAA